MNQRRIVTPAPRSLAPRPVVSAGAIKEDKNWTFSFSHWKQITYFGLSNVPRNWVVDLLDGLKDTAPYLEELIEGNPSLRNTFHFHVVFWSKAKVKLRRSDLEWIPKEILENEDEFPMYQLSLGKGPLRVIGYWTSDSRVFNIVLIDPHHNIHIADGFESGTYCTNQLSAHYQLLCAVNDLACACSTSTCQCEAYRGVSHLTKAHGIKGVIYVDPDVIEEALTLIHSQGATMTDLLTCGLLYYQEQNRKN